MRQKFFASLIALLAFPSYAAQIDFGKNPLTISSDTTWILDGQPTTITSGSFNIGSGTTLTLQDNPTLNVDWFSAGNIEIDGSLYAPGLNLVFHTNNNFTLMGGTIAAASISIYAGGTVALDTFLPRSNGGANGLGDSVSLISRP